MVAENPWFWTVVADEAGIYSDFAMDLEPNVRYCQYNIDENDENLGDLLSGAKSSLTEGPLRNLSLYSMHFFFAKDALFV